MIYIASDVEFLDFNTFSGAAQLRDRIPEFYPGVLAIETGVSWKDFSALYYAVHNTRPTLLASASSVVFFEGKSVAVGQLFLPGDFFEQCDGVPSAKMRTYSPLDEWSITSNIDGDYFWDRCEDCSAGFYAPAKNVFAALTSSLEGQIWCDWHRFPPRQQTLMQHWAAEVQVRRGK